MMRFCRSYSQEHSHSESEVRPIFFRGSLTHQTFNQFIHFVLTEIYLNDIGLQSWTSSKEQACKRTDLPLPYQALLHLQYPNHLADSLRIKPLLPLSSAPSQVQRKLLRRLHWKVVGVWYAGPLCTCRWPRLLHIATSRVGRHSAWSLPLPILLHVRDGLMCFLLPHLDWCVRTSTSWCCH